MICPHTPTGLVPGNSHSISAGPARMMIEMAGDERNVDVARLADRLAVVDRFQDREKALPLLHMARERIEMLRPLEAGKRRPFGLRLPRRGDGGVDVARRALGRARDPLAGRRIEDVEQVAGLGEGAVDEAPEAALVLVEPGPDVLAAFGRGAIVHRAQNVLDQGHGRLTPSRGDGPPNSARSRNGRAAARCRSRGRSPRCGTGRAASTSRPSSSLIKMSQASASFVVRKPPAGLKPMSTPARSR